MNNIYQKLLNKETKLSVIGLGYVGLPIALEFARKVSVIGFDIKPDRVEKMNRKIDPSEELDSSAFEGTDITFTCNPEDLKAASFHIIAVPTPIDKHNLPDLTAVLKAAESVGKILKKGDYVVYESTVYPGCTEEDCVPVLERFSGLKFNEDFKVGFSPERINPGDKDHTIRTITKIVSGSCDESLDQIAKVYELVVDAGVHRASCIKVAEAAKIIENTQRDVNIALMNELSRIFNLMHINTYEVLEAAGTKWNFLKFVPGLVGGHCIGVDPYYLTHKAREYRYHCQIIDAGRALNDDMGYYIAKLIVQKMISQKTHVLNSKVLIMGATFKEDVADIRNSRIVDVINELKGFGCEVDVIDPCADSHELQEEYGFSLCKNPGNDYDVVVVAVNHKPYCQYDEVHFKSIMKPTGILFDIKGMYRGKIKDLTYLSL